MRLLRSLLALLLLAAALPSLAAPGAVTTTEQVRAELVAHAPQGVVPGTAACGWAWRSSTSRTGTPTGRTRATPACRPRCNGTLPEGVKAGEIEWPTPQRLPIGPLMNHGYEGRLLLPVRVEVPAGFSADTLPVKLRADWLVCKDVCIPESGEFALDIPARSAWSAQAAAFEAAFAARPQTLASAKASAQVGSEGLILAVDGLPSDWAGKAIEFFPEAPGVLDNALPRRASWDGQRWTLQVPLSDQRIDAPSRMDAVLVAAGSQTGARIGFEIAGAWPAAPGTTPKPLAGGGARCEHHTAAGPGRGAAVRTARWRAAQPDALRLPGPLAEGDRLRVPCR